MKQLLMLLLFFWSSNTFLSAQSAYRAGLLPAINVNQKLPDQWRLNYKAETRFIMAEGAFAEPAALALDHSLIDLSTIVSKQFGSNKSMAGGYLIRLREKEVNHRFIQQLAIVQRYETFRLAHRFSTDQTFGSEGPPEFRLRYRISTDFALNGQSVNQNEFYVKVNHEYLGALEATEVDLEIRLVPLLGYYLNDNRKIEWGLDYRINSFLNGPSRSSFWLVMNAFLVIE